MTVGDLYRILNENQMITIYNNDDILTTLYKGTAYNMSIAFMDLRVSHIVPSFAGSLCVYLSDHAEVEKYGIRNI